MLASARGWAEKHPRQKQGSGLMATASVARAMLAMSKSIGRSTAASKVRHVKLMRTSLDRKCPASNDAVDVSSARKT